MRALLAAGALALAAFLAAAGGLALAQGQAQKVPVPTAQGGNKALMEEWVRKKQALRDQVYKELRRQGALPKNGHVTVEATVVPDPKNPEKTRVRIDSLSIQEQPAKPANTNTDPVFGPRSPGGQTEFVTGSLPVPGQKMRETITFIGGKPQ